MERGARSRQRSSAAPRDQHADLVAASPLRERHQRAAPGSRRDRPRADRSDAAPRHRNAGSRGPRACPSASTAAGRRARRARRSAVVEQELAEVRNALRGLTPAENLVGFEDAVRGLSQKIDMIAEKAQAPGGDPRAFKQLEQAVTSLRGVVSNVASDGALAQLSAEVHGLAGQFERAAAESSLEALTRLEARIAANDGKRPRRAAGARRLDPRVERAARPRAVEPGRSARARRARGSHRQALGKARGLQRAAFPARRGRARPRRPAGASRGNEQTAARTLRAAPPAEPAPEPAGPQHPAPLAPARDADPASARRGLLRRLAARPYSGDGDGRSADRSADRTAQQRAPTELAPLAPRAAPLAEAEYMLPTAPQQRPRGKAMPRGPARQPIDPNLPPDTPLEPGSGAPRVRPGSAAARIAASEAALERLQAFGVRSRQQVGSDCRSPQRREVRLSRHAGEAAEAAARRGPWLLAVQKRSRRRGAIFGACAYAAADASRGTRLHAAADAGRPMSASHPTRRCRAASDAAVPEEVLIATCVAIIVVGTAMTAMDYLFNDIPPLPNVETWAQTRWLRRAQKRRAEDHACAGRPMPSPQGSLIVPGGADPEATGQIGNMSSFFDPSTVIAPKQTKTT